MECPSKLVEDRLEVVDSACRALAEGLEGVLVDGTAVNGETSFAFGGRDWVGGTGPFDWDLESVMEWDGPATGEDSFELLSFRKDRLLGFLFEGKVTVATDEAIDVRGEVFGVK